MTQFPFQIPVRCNQELHDEIIEASWRMRLSKAELIRKAVKQYIENFNKQQSETPKAA